MLLTTHVDVVWHYSTRPHYISKGYVFTRFGDSFSAKVEDLPRYSRVRVEVVCDRCKRAKTMHYNSYRATVTEEGTYGCNYCKSAASKDKNLEYLDAITRRGFELVSPLQELTYNGIITVKCIQHGTLKTIRYSKFVQAKVACADCREARNRSKDNREIHNYLRRFLGEWKQLWLGYHDYQCWVSGIRDAHIQVHHLGTASSTIVRKALKDLGLKPGKVADYTKDQLSSLVSAYVAAHSSIVGVPLAKNIHEALHKRYGKARCSSEDLYEFKEEYLRSNPRDYTDIELEEFVDFCAMEGLS